jgi:GT2 family glycosyltransferase
MSMSDPTVSVVIPNWNGRKLLEAYLPSVLKAARRAGAGVIVADDASSDDSVSWLAEHAPGVEVLTSEINRGFLRNANRGVMSARSDVVILLNNDVETEEDFIAPLLRHFERDDVFGVSPAILSLTHEGADEGVNHFTFEHGLILSKFLCLQGMAPPTAPAPIGYVCGAAAAYDRKKFLELGGFDVLFSPNYFEDADLGYSAWKRGWRVVYEPASIVRHQHSATMKQCYGPSRLRRLFAERMFWFNWKHLGDRDLLLYHALWLLRLPVSHIRHGRWPELAGYFLAPRRLIKALRSRRQSAAVRTDAEVMRLSNPYAGNGAGSPGSGTGAGE